MAEFHALLIAEIADLRASNARLADALKAAEAEREAIARAVQFPLHREDEEGETLTTYCETWRFAAEDAQCERDRLQRRWSKLRTALGHAQCMTGLAVMDEVEADDA